MSSARDEYCGRAIFRLLCVRFRSNRTARFWDRAVSDIVLVVAKSLYSREYRNGDNGYFAHYVIFLAK